MKTSNQGAVSFGRHTREPGLCGRQREVDVGYQRTDDITVDQVAHEQGTVMNDAGAEDLGRQL